MSLERADKIKKIPDCPAARKLLHDYYCRELVRLKTRQRDITKLKAELESYTKPPTSS